MQYDWIDSYLLSKKGVTKDFQADWKWERYKLADKMFAAVCYDDNNEPYYITVKLDPTEGELLRQAYEDIIPGYYMNKVHWNSIKVNGNLEVNTVRDILDHAYETVFKGLTRKIQAAITTEP